MVMKTNELSLQEMQQTNGGLTIRQIPETGGGGNMPIMDTSVPANTEQAMPPGGIFGMWDEPQNSSGDVSPM